MSTRATAAISPCATSPTVGASPGHPWTEQMSRKMLRNVEKRRVQAARNGPSLPPCVTKAEMSRADRLGSRERAAWATHLRHQCQLVQEPLSLELNRRLVVKSRLSEVFSAVNGSVGPPHFFAISSNLTMINTHTIGSVLTLHCHFHLSPLDPLARKREG